MTAKEPIENFLEEFLKLLELTETQLPKNMSPDLQLQLEVFEKFMEMLNNANEAVYKRLGISEEDLKHAIEHTENVREDQKKLLDRLKKMKSDLENLKREVTIAGTIARHREALEGKKGPKSGFSGRNKRFDALGARKNWKPM